MLMLDRITHISTQGGEYGKGEIIAELDITPDLWFFDCHFHGDPVMPGCLGLDAMWQLVGFYLCWRDLPGRGRALGSGKVKFTGQVLPDAKLVTYQIDIKRVITRKLNMAIADATMSVDGREIYTTEGEAGNRSLVLFDRGEEIVVTAGPKGIRFLLVSGKPLEEPVAWHGPIVMNTKEQIRQALSDLRQGTFIREE